MENTPIELLDFEGWEFECKGFDNVAVARKRNYWDGFFANLDPDEPIIDYVRRNADSEHLRNLGEEWTQ